MYLTWLYESLGVRITILAFFLACSWCLGFIFDPLVGYLSDTIKSHIGRRRIFIAIGAIIYPIIIMLLFSPPDGLTERGYYWWFGVFFALFFAIYSVSNVPYLALGYQLAGTVSARKRLFTVERCFECLGYLLAAGGPSFILSYRSVFFII